MVLESEGENQMVGYRLRLKIEMNSTFTHRSQYSTLINLRAHNLIRPTSILIKMSEPASNLNPKDSDPLKRFNTPLSGLFAINKPSGMISMKLLNSLQPLFSRSPLFTDGHSVHPSDCTSSGQPKSKSKRSKSRRKALVKIGQGGTLDPLASGVLVVGLNSATKRLSAFLDCTKTYQTIGLLGCETDSYDQMGKVVKLVSWKDVKPQDIIKQCEIMKGPGWQIPPM